MSSPLTAAETLNREYLEIRAKILEVAASLDRLDRSSGEVADDPRMKLVREGIGILSSEGDRAEQVQMLFSRHYEDDWQNQFNLNSPR